MTTLIVDVVPPDVSNLAPGDNLDIIEKCRTCQECCSESYG